MEAIRNSDGKSFTSRKASNALFIAKINEGYRSASRRVLQLEAYANQGQQRLDKKNGDILLRQVIMNFCSIIATLSFGPFRSFVGFRMSIADRDQGLHASIQKIGGSGFSIYTETEKSFEESFEFTS